MSLHSQDTNGNNNDKLEKIKRDIQKLREMNEDLKDLD